MAESNNKLPRIALTMGDPEGIGPELLVRTVALWRGKRFVPVAFGDTGILEVAAEKFAGGKLKVEEVFPDRLPEEPEPKTLYCVSLSDIEPDEVLNSKERRGYRFGEEVHEYLISAADAAMAGDVDAIVTAPLAKTALAAAGVRFPGHTEILAEQAGVGSRFAMMLAGAKLRVTLATVHVPLRDVPSKLSAQNIVTAAELTHEWLVRYFGIPQPRIAVAGLNPHAGESGLLGSEEKELIAPVVEGLQRRGVPVDGPHAPDTVFFRAHEGDFDAVICMYHDQGLIPLKLLHFHSGVNLTLGLPFIRTSPDHGTAFDIAWRDGKARLDSFAAAVRLAIDLSRRGKKAES